MALRLDEWRLKMSEGVTSSLAKLTSAGDRAAARFTRLQDRIGKSLTGAQNTLATGWKGLGNAANDYKTRLIEALPLPSSMASGLAAMGGPLTVAVALAGALTLGLMKGVQAAEAYGVPFRELRNLNLDKSKAELDELNKRVLGISFDKGLDPTKMVAGIYDVQSTIGQFGPEVEGMVGRIGEVSRALNMDFTQAVAGVGKALVQFKLPLTDVDRLLTSNAKTVQVGVVTFDELSKVQTEYAGAASSMNQELDTANKVFALLTTNTKNADIAATMAKAAFQDLGKGDTIAGLKKIGVNVFDVQGRMRQTDQILRELVPVLGQMSDQTFAKLKEEIGGSEGLRGLLDMTKASGSEVLRVLDTFDKAQFNVGDAIARSNGDLDIMKDKISNQLTTAWTELGLKIMPIWVKVLAGVTAIVSRAGDFITMLQQGVAWMKDLYANSLLVRLAVQSIVVVAKALWAGFKVIVENIMLMIKTPIQAIGHLLKGEFKEALSVMTNGGVELMENLSGGAMDIGHAVADGFEAAFSPQLNEVPVSVKPVLDGGMPSLFDAQQAVKPVLDGSLPSLYTAQQVVKPVLDGQGLGVPPVQQPATGADMVKAPGVLGKLTPPKAAEPSPVMVKVDATTAAASKPTLANDPFAKLFASKDEKGTGTHHVKEGVSQVVGGGQQQRNVHVRIDSLVKQLTIQTTHLKEGTADIKRQVEEALIRAVQGSELAIAND